MSVIKNVKLSFLARISFSLVMLAIMVCFSHVGLNDDQHVARADTHTESSQGVCIDHQASANHSREQGVVTTPAILTSIVFDIPLVAINTYREICGSSAAPPDKIALYVKNNIFLI